MGIILKSNVFKMVHFGLRETLVLPSTTSMLHVRVFNIATVQSPFTDLECFADDAFLILNIINPF